MLRITKEQTNGVAVLNLAGKLKGPWVEALREEADKTRLAGPVELDLSRIGFVDAAGVELLRDLIRGGVHIGNCSSFVRELLQMEEPRS
jgi:ABC-type transporter Mla MlaB component